jgi:hypothetical protein
LFPSLSLRRPVIGSKTISDIELDRTFRKNNACRYTNSVQFKIRISLGRNWIELIPTNAFSELLLLKDLNLRQAGNPVKTIQEFAFSK